MRPDMDPARPDTVAPGAYAFAGYDVTWWDPSLLHLHAVSSFGLRRDDLIVKDGDMFAVEDRRAEYERWRLDREALIERGGTPSLRVQTATAWAAEAAESGIDTAIAAGSAVKIVKLAGADGRPRGPRFGTLVHAILAIVPLDADADAIMKTAEVQGRIVASPPEEVAAAVQVVSAVLKHDLMMRARASARVRRETPITWTQPDGMLIEGVLDLAFDEGEETVVIDFKTDHELVAGEARYRAQVQQYVNAVALATGRTAAGVLFKI
jgi:ATP-dependent exoDNAse (exonuclease V) beta subunit